MGQNNLENGAPEKARAWDSVFLNEKRGISSMVIDNRKLKDFLPDNFHCLWEGGGALIC